MPQSVVHTLLLAARRRCVVRYWLRNMWRRSYQSLLVLVVCAVVLIRSSSAGVEEERVSEPTGAFNLTSHHPADVSASESVSASAGSMMPMTFFGGVNFCLWFESFHIGSIGSLVAACIGLAAMAAAHEGIRVARVKIANSRHGDPLTRGHHWLQTSLHLLQVAVSYLLMLAVMSFSSWIFASVCIGAAAGYAFFGRFVPTSSLLGEFGGHC